jgi:hypothetical protein
MQLLHLTQQQDVCMLRAHLVSAHNEGKCLLNMWKRRCFILYHTINVLKTNYINNKAYAEQDAAAVKLFGMLSLTWYQLS